MGATRTLWAQLIVFTTSCVFTIQTINVCILPDQLVAFGNTTEPCGYVELLSGGLGVEENKTISAAISKFIKEKLGIEPTRLV